MEMKGLCPEITEAKAPHFPQEGFTGTRASGHPTSLLPECVSNTVPKIKEVLMILDH